MEKSSYRVRYALRKPYKRAKSLETGVPWMVVEKEARAREMSVEKFIENYEVECLFDAFEGLHYRFVSKVTAQPDKSSSPLALT